MSQKTRGPNSPYRGDPPGGAPGAPGGPPPQAKTMYLIALANETTEDYLDERRNGGPEQFQIIQLMTPQGQMTKFVRGKTVWDSFAETAMGELVAGPQSIEDITTNNVEDAAKKIAFIAAKIADAMLEEKRKRDPTKMLVEVGSRLVM